MADNSKERWFQIALWSAAGLYAWSCFIIWVGPEWGLSSRLFYLTGVLPAVVGVFAMSAAVGLHIDICEQKE
ncbi:MAG: hypothetical protein BRD55_06275 [Bacteroidetes bacterium SW_9_63_38]|nr:MAG: hypothetical protein BRD55_06275 [Bacteroidetes bacterium SW_9_63_38]